MPLTELLEKDPRLEVAWNAALSAGSFLLHQRPVDLVIDTKSTPTDLVSAMDKQAEEMVFTALRTAHPDDAFLGEEGPERPGTSGVRWVVDPLDGTVNYLFGFPMWAVSIGMEVEGETQVGVISTPAFDEHYIALRGGGAWLITGDLATRLNVRECHDLSLSMIVTGFGYAPERRTDQAHVVWGLISKVRDIRRLGAAVVDFAWLARGRCDAYYETGLHPWDKSAGMLLAAEAGAVVTVEGDTDETNLMIAAVPGISDALRVELRQLGAYPTR